MADQTLLSFIRDHLARGVNGDEIREILLAAGWPEADVDAALEEVWATQQDLFRQAQEASQERSRNDAATTRDRRIARSKDILVRIAVAGVLLGGIGWTAWMFVPDMLFRILGERLSSVKAFEYRIGIVTDGTVSDMMGGVLPKGISSPKRPDADETAIDGRGEVRISFDGAFDGAADIPKTQASFSLVSGAGESAFSIGGEFRSVDRTYYARLKQFVIPGAPDAGALTEKWISFDPKSFGGKGSVPVSPSKLSAEKPAGGEPIVPTPDFESALRIMFRDGAIILGDTRWFDGSVDGGRAVAIAFSVDRERFRLAMEALEKPEFGFQKRQLDLLRQWVASEEAIDGTVWIGWRTFLPRKLQIVKTGADTRTVIDADFPAYGKAVSIEKPADGDVVPMADALSELFVSLSGSRMPKDAPSFPAGTPAR